MDRKGGMTAMTERLYYQDAYRTGFEGRVLACVQEKDRWRVLLDRSAFYPTSGGQPFDTGTLGNARVTDVEVKDGEVWHTADAPLTPGETVQGRVDWPRRFDHMQQHAADHMIAGLLHHMYGAVTIGLHISEEISTIDVAMPEGRVRLSGEEIASLEEEVNRRVQGDLPIRCWFPGPDELKALPLRKRPTVSEHVRIVAIGDYEMVPCGGTHPASTGEIGLIKILFTEPARGKLRLGFIAGMRAFSEFRRCYSLLHESAELFSTSVDNVPGSIRQMSERLNEARIELRQLRRERMLEKLRALEADAPALPGGGRLLVLRESLSRPELLEAVTLAVSDMECVALACGCDPEAAEFVLGRSPSLSADLNRVFRACAQITGGRGGGKPDLVQGIAPAATLEKVAETLRSVPG
ncbi:MAG: hypothetical protein IJH78_07400 [Clostridia bacterium]|nr:hypothetical protein [Clostridia bacterium]